MNQLFWWCGEEMLNCDKWCCCCQTDGLNTWVCFQNDWIANVGQPNLIHCWTLALYCIQIAILMVSMHVLQLQLHGVDMDSLYVEFLLNLILYPYCLRHIDNSLTVSRMQLDTLESWTDCAGHKSSHLKLILFVCSVSISICARTIADDKRKNR